MKHSLSKCYFNPFNLSKNIKGKERKNIMGPIRPTPPPPLLLLGPIPCFKVVQDGSLVEVGQVGHVLAPLELGRVDLLDLQQEVG